MKTKNYYRRKLSLLLFIVVLIIFVIISSLSISRTNRFSFITSHKTKEKQEHIEKAIKKIVTLIEISQSTPQDIADILEIYNAKTEDIDILLHSFLFITPEFSGTAICYEPYQHNKDSLYFSYFLYRSGDSIIYTNLNDPEYNYFYKDWYLVPKTLQRPTWSEPYIDEANNNKLTATYSVPFYNFDGRKRHFGGIVTLDLFVNTITSFAQDLGEELHGKAFLISENGTIISAQEETWIGNETIFSLSSELQIPELREIGRALKNGESGKKQLNHFEDQKDIVAFYQSIEINNWGFLLLVTQEELKNN